MQATYNLSKLAQLKDRHRNKRCYIVASGPSTKAQDLSELANEFVIGVNQSYLVTQRYGFDPTFICLSDPYLFERMISHYKDLNSGIIFGRVPLEQVAKNYPYDNLIGVIPWHTAVKISAKDQSVPNNVFRGFFSHDLPNGIYPAFNVVPELAIPLALFCGANEIYLLGCDCNNEGYSYTATEDLGLGQGRTAGIAPSPEHMWNDMIFPAYETIKQYTEALGVSIYNASPGGNLQVFPRVAFASLVRPPKLL